MGHRWPECLFLPPTLSLLPGKKQPTDGAFFSQPSSAHGQWEVEEKTHEILPVGVPLFIKNAWREGHKKDFWFHVLSSFKVLWQSNRGEAENSFSFAERKQNPNRKKSAQQKAQRNVALQCPALGVTEPPWALVQSPVLPSGRWDGKELDAGAAAEASLPWG